uniref:Uncharacterized protein n=1 Tax=Neovison vison TaxID=452646 RepID=A0A8C7B333_NEOVI
TAVEARDLHLQGPMWLPNWKVKKSSGCPTWT